MQVSEELEGRYWSSVSKATSTYGQEYYFRCFWAFPSLVRICVSLTCQREKPAHIPATSHMN